MSDTEIIEVERLHLGVDQDRRRSRLLCVLDEYQAGVKIKDIATKYGIAEGTVSAYAGKAGVGRRYRSIQCKPEVVAAYQAGMPIKDICTTFEVDRKSIWSWAIAAGVPLRLPRKSAGERTR